MPPTLTLILGLLHQGVIPALAILVICVIRLKPELYQANFIHSDFEYYYNPLILFRYIRTKIRDRQSLSPSLIIFLIATALIIADCVLYQAARLLYHLR